MKRLLLTLLIFTFLISLVGCSNTNDKNELMIIPQKNSESKNNIDNMVIDYKINNLYGDDYDIQVYAKEYNYGELKDTYDLVQTQIKTKDTEDSLSTSVYENNGNIEVNVGNTSLSLPLDFFTGSKENGMAFSALENDKEIQLNKDLSLAVFSIGKKGETTEGLNVDEDFKLGTNEKDLVIYLKINKTN